MSVTATTWRAPARGPRADLEEQLYNVRRSIEALDVIIEQTYSVCLVSGSSNDNGLDSTYHGFGEEGSQDALRDAWKRVTSLGMERKTLRHEARALMDALDELEKRRPAMKCEVCGKTLDQQRSSRRYCNAACKQKAWRQGMAKRRGNRTPPLPNPMPWIGD